MTEYRAHFDATVEFSNGGGLTAEAFRIDLPGATATDFWGTAGVDIHQLPAEWVMPATAMVDAALAGFDQGEFATIPALPELADWTAFEAARGALTPNLSRSWPAKRYGVPA